MEGLSLYQLTKLVAAAAAARSGFALVVRAARGKAEPAAGGPLLVLLEDRFTPPAAVVELWIVDIGRLELALFTGELLDAVRSLDPSPLTVEDGGSGSGLTPDVALADAKRFAAGEYVAGVKCERVLRGGALTPVINSCFNASWGLRRRLGSHLRQRAMKSRKALLSHFRACRRSLELGLRRRPFEDTVRRALPEESKNSFFRVLFSMRCFSGGPKISIMQASCSCSFSPGNSGYPVYNSASIQPRLHISMGIP